MLLLRNILFLLCTCHFWKPTELSVVEFADLSFTYGRNFTPTKEKIVDSNKPFISRRISGPIPTPKCSHEHYCEKVDGYPAEQLLAILNAHKDLKNFFGVDKEPIENRMVSPRDTYLCAIHEKVVFPQTLKDPNDNWQYVVNQPGGFEQGVRVETCVEDQRGCKLVDPPLGYTTTCKQKYSYRRLLSISSTGEPQGKLLVLPTACCCSYTLNRN